MQAIQVAGGAELTIATNVSGIQAQTVQQWELGFRRGAAHHFSWEDSCNERGVDDSLAEGLAGFMRSRLPVHAASCETARGSSMQYSVVWWECTGKFIGVTEAGPANNEYRGAGSAF